jgi:hypothetical protein
MKNHLIIAGTGRAGTSLLVRYLTECGLETHITRNGDSSWNEDANAGLEDLPLPGIDCPYVIKSPWFFEYVDALVQRKDIIVDAVIMPVRDLVEASASRSILELKAIHTNIDFIDRMKTWETWAYTPGGIVYSMNPIDQARILALGFYKTVHALVRRGIKIVFLEFPRFVEDADYLYDQLTDFLPKHLEKDAALNAHAKVADLSKVRTEAEISESHNKTAPGQEAKIFETDIEYPTFDAVDNIALKRAISTIRKLLDESSLQGKNLLGERDTLLVERDALLVERDALLVERDALLVAKNTCRAERDAMEKQLAVISKVFFWRFFPKSIKRFISTILFSNH